MKIMHAFGSRACAIKMAPLLSESAKRGHSSPIVWSGQHYDDNLYAHLFEDLGLPKPDYDIKARGSAPALGAKILVEMERILQKEKPDIVLTHGDTYTAMFFSLAAAMAGAPVGHVEAGLRTYSWEPFPEQICTKAADAASSLFFAATEKNRRDLLAEHVPDGRIFVTGNTVVDATLRHERMAREKSRILERFPAHKDGKPLIYWSAHRKENLMQEERARGLFETLLELKEARIFCSVLPSTQAAAEKIGYAKRLAEAEHLWWEPCLAKYTDSLRLMLEADLLLTDSGGMQEEACGLHIPCLTLRQVTDRPESVQAGANKCVGCSKEKVVREVRALLGDGRALARMRAAPNPYGDGKSAGRILDVIERFEGKMQRWEKEKTDKA